MSGTCSIRLMGGFEFEVNGRPVPTGAWRHRRGADLAKLLALAPGHRLHREQVMDALWPDMSPDAAGTNLRKATLHLRRALGTPDAVVTDAGFVALNPEWPATTDVDAFDTAANAALGSSGHTCAEAAGLYHGELLPDDRYATWSIEPRERLRLRYVQLLRLAEQWEAILAVDPADEEAHRALMRDFVDAGNRQAALRQFTRLREALRSDLGVGPDGASVEIYEEALALHGASPPSPKELVGGLLGRGLFHWNRMELQEARRCGEEARTLAIDEGLQRELGEATALVGMTANAQGSWREMFSAEFEETVRERPDTAPYVFEGHLCLAEYSLHGPDSHDELEPFARALLAIATDAGSSRGEGLAWLMLGEAALFAGRLSDAASALNRAAKLHRSSGAESALALTLIRSAETAVAQDKRAHAARQVERGMAIARTAPLAPHLVVRAYAAQVLAATAPERANAAVDEAEQTLSESLCCQICSINYQVLAAITRAESGDITRGQRHLEKAERIAGMWQGGPWQAAVWEARGTIRLAEGDRAQGTALLTEAASLFADAGRPLDATRCRNAAS
jgi:DNA-binding SARP family transcriptional activator